MGDRHLKFHELRDNLPALTCSLTRPGSPDQPNYAERGGQSKGEWTDDLLFAIRGREWMS